MAKRGRPSPYKPDFHPQDFLRLSEQGRVVAQIARDWKVSRSTLYEWKEKYPEFSDALKKGKEYAEAWWIDLGTKAMLNIAQEKETKKPIKVNLGYYVWLTKNLFRWADQIEQDTNVKAEVKNEVYVCEFPEIKMLPEAVDVSTDEHLQH